MSDTYLFVPTGSVIYVDHGNRLQHMTVTREIKIPKESTPKSGFYHLTMEGFHVLIDRRLARKHESQQKLFE